MWEYLWKEFHVKIGSTLCKWKVRSMKHVGKPEAFKNYTMKKYPCTLIVEPYMDIT